MRESRLFKIVYHLLDKGQATAPELAERFEVSVRTIYRDIDALSEAGIPIYAETGRNGGIHLMKDFVLDKAALSAIFILNTENWLEVDFSRWGNKQDDNKKFEILKSAVIRRRAVRITYAGSYKFISERTIYPLKLSYKSRAWYIKAYCTEKNGYRIFKLTRILDLEALDESFSYRAFPEQSNSGQQECHPITLRFPREMSYRVYDEFDNTEVSIQENGDLLVSARMPEDMWLVGYLLSFGTQVEIIEPLYLKNVIAEQAKQIYEKNKP